MEWIIFAIAAIASGTGAVMQAQAARKQAKMDRYMAEYNAKLAEREQQKEAQESLSRQEEMRRKGAAAIGTQKSLLAKGGVVMSEGSPLLVLADTAAQIELDIQREQYESRERGIGLEVQKSYSLMDAKAADGRKNAATWAGVAGVGSALLSGVSGYQAFKGPKTAPTVNKD
jgi:hypothetical protein